MASQLGTLEMIPCTMFYICEMTGRLWSGHDGVLMLMKNIVMIAHILGTTYFGFGVDTI